MPVMHPNKPLPKTKTNKLCSKFLKMRYDRTLSYKAQPRSRETQMELSSSDIELDINEF